MFVLASVLLVTALQIPTTWGAPVPGWLDTRVTQANVAQTVCRPGYMREVRPDVAWSRATKDRLLAEGHLTGRRASYELDHLVPLGLGGHPTDPRNLWLQPWADARVKDEQEARLWHAVCDGRMTLEQAQHEILKAWGSVQ